MLPFYLQDESEEEYAKASHKRHGKSEGGAAQFDNLRKAAKGMRKEASVNVGKKVASNKKHYDASRRAKGADLKVGDTIAIRRGQFTRRMHGRLAFRYDGPYVVTQVKGRSVTCTDAIGGKVAADVDNCKVYRNRPAKYTAE